MVESFSETLTNHVDMVAESGRVDHIKADPSGGNTQAGREKIMARKGAATKEREMDTDTEQTDTDTEAVEAEATEAEGTEAEAKAPRAKTTYFDPTEVTALDDLPENPKVTRTGGGRAAIYHDLLEKVAEQGIDNKWRPLAKFGTSSGGKTVALALNRQVEGKIGEGKGEVKPNMLKDIPQYDGCKWVFDSRRVPSETDKDKIESVLYAKLVEVEAETEAEPEVDTEAEG